MRWIDEGSGRAELIAWLSDATGRGRNEFFLRCMKAFKGTGSLSPAQEKCLRHSYRRARDAVARGHPWIRCSWASQPAAGAE